MPRKTKALKYSDEFYSSEKIRQLKAQYYFLVGGRNLGKSYDIKKLFIERAFSDYKKPIQKNRFIYLRRYDEDVRTPNVEQYFKDLVCNKYGENVIEKITNGIYNDVKARSNKIYLIHINKDTGENDEPMFHIGYYGCLNNAQRLKSQAFLDINNIVLEEFIPERKPLLYRECDEFASIVSTIARDRQIEVFLLGNNCDREIEYFNYFGIDNWLKQEVGTIDTYERTIENGDGTDTTVKMAVERIPDKIGSQKMFTGNIAQNLGQSYYTREQAKINQNYLYENFEKIYELYCQYNNFKWKLTMFMNPKTADAFWYIRPTTKELTPDDRVITNKTTMNRNWSGYFKPLNDYEAKGFEILQEGKVYFNQDLTGTEFRKYYIQMLNNPFIKGCL